MNEFERVSQHVLAKEALETESFNGHKNWSHWNVALWLDNNEDNYSHVQDIIKRHVKGEYKYNSFTKICRVIQNSLPKNTPDGARYSLKAIEAYLIPEIEEFKRYNKA